MRTRQPAKCGRIERWCEDDMMCLSTTLAALLMADPVRWRLLGLVGSLGLPDCWIGAGFVRDAAWDHLHFRASGPPCGDIDVVWFDPEQADAAVDKALEAKLRSLDPLFDWSVKNQARMHVRNGDAAYISTIDAMRNWPETATAVAARRTGSDDCVIAAPFGLDDLFALVVRPTPRFRGVKLSLYLDRVRTKQWQTVWPGLRIVAED